MPAPTTQWIKDSGVIVEPTTGYLIDELGNYFIDEFGYFLEDTVSSSGDPLPQSWNDIEEPKTGWSDSFEASTTTNTRVTASGNTRVTAQGDTRIATTSPPNIQNPQIWTRDEY